MPDLPLPDVTLHYEINGEGPPLLLIAGMLSDHATFAPLMPALTQHFTVIRPDNRTAGRTVPWDAPASVQIYAADVLALMDHLGHGQFHVAGHSLGGLIAMELAGANPARVQSLSVMASAPLRAPRTMTIFDTLRDIRAQPQGETLWLRALYPWVFGPAFFNDPQAEQAALTAAQAYPYGQTLAAMTHQIEALRSYRPTVALDQITPRTMVLHAEQDILIPRAAAQKAFEALPNGQQFTLQGAGHSIHWDAPTQVAQHLIDFCNA
ncbi:MAG: alpha/beta fold hydrolase [Sulfitobacter sp.]